MRKLVRDSQGNTLEIVIVKGGIPEGLVEVPAEELQAEELNFARKNKLEEIRGKRNVMLRDNDREWLIASKKGESTEALEAEAKKLRDLPAEAEKKLKRMRSLERIKSYDAFAEDGGVDE